MKPSRLILLRTIAIVRIDSATKESISNMLSIMGYTNAARTHAVGEF
jgi:hypothetical protein